tara:strand:+ start:113 stop:277 length:165 start_codon:yes stop_codon:yes gene_type:complete
MSTIQYPQKDPQAEAQMEQLGKDLENIELMNQWGKEDSEKARKSSDQKQAPKRN